ncbi:phage adaptor protein [Novosphingobium panipatense]|uniref:Uncharacterized protein n=1 Tax=Novosphingobium panipatense TaxID=428991 RepID=A0ABY1Q5R4_9SPHN|nr:hypothetical protein [Novosphingobium panipatense]SMP58344.1 hypothetical protein SAMN06296065_102454 [Novosphingobium panipatense]
MSFGRLKTRLRALINRKDLTDELAGDFVLDAISAIERVLRIGPMEILLVKSDWDGARNAVSLPPNLLETITVFTEKGELDFADLDSFLKYEGTGKPAIYTRVADRYLVKPTPSPGTVLYVHYYGETLRPTLDDDKTVWTEAGFLATLYKAAQLAADFYQMEADVVGGYQSRYEEHAVALEQQALSEAWSARITIPAPTNVGEY